MIFTPFNSTEKQLVSHALSTKSLVSRVIIKINTYLVRNKHKHSGVIQCGMHDMSMYTSSHVNTLDASVRLRDSSLYVWNTEILVCL